MLITKEEDIINGCSVVYTKCDYCGDVTKTNYRNFLRGRKNIDKDSCTHCVGKKCAEITSEKRQNMHFSRLKAVCEENGYTLKTKKEDIVNNETYITYECPIHGDQKMKIANLLSGKRCPKCCLDAASKRYRNDKNYVIKSISDCGGELVNPDDYINGRTKNLKIKCPSCGNEFVTSFVIFTQHGGQLCENCHSSESVGETRIRKYLEKKNIEFLQEHWFKDCRDINPLPFDFYIPSMNLIIEFDGRQHFQDTNLFSYSFEKTKLHDEIKNKYCLDNGIDIVRISYKQINNTEKILDSIFT